MNPDDERQAFWAAVHTVDDRVTDLKARFEERDAMTLDMIRAAVRDAMPTALLSDDEHRWVQMAIAREAQMIAFRRAVIEKTFIGLVWAGIIALGIVVREYAIAHGVWRP
jgi:hypothetical protein